MCAHVNFFNFANYSSISPFIIDDDDDSKELAFDSIWTWSLTALFCIKFRPQPDEICDLSTLSAQYARLLAITYVSENTVVYQYFDRLKSKSKVNMSMFWLWVWQVFLNVGKLITSNISGFAVFFRLLLGLWPMILTYQIFQILSIGLQKEQEREKGIQAQHFYSLTSNLNEISSSIFYYFT